MKTIGSRATIDIHIVAIDNKRIVAGATVEVINPITTMKPVVTIAAQQSIIAIAAMKSVRANTAVDEITLVTAIHGVVSGAAG